MVVVVAVAVLVAVLVIVAVVVVTGISVTPVLGFLVIVVTIRSPLCLVFDIFSGLRP